MFGLPADIEFHPLVHFEPTLITRCDHPLAKRKRIALKDIAKYPLILPPQSCAKGFIPDENSQ